MARIDKTVFVSYRHTKIPWALAISQYLTHNGYDLFFDYMSINSGDFEQVIIENIKARGHFLVLLAPSVLDECENPKDWLRREIEIAIDNKRNIIPIMLEGFDFGARETLKYLTGKLGRLKKYNGLNLYADYFEEGMQRLCDRFLNIPLEAVIHPISDNVQVIVTEQKKAIASEAKVEEKILTAQEWFEKGYKSIELEDKIRFYNRAIELNPKYSEAYHNRGDTYRKLGQDERAIADYSQAIKLNDIAAYNNRGHTYRKLAQYERAIADYDQVLKLNPNNLGALNNRGHCYHELGQYAQAIADYSQAIKLKPNDNTAYNNRGHTYLKLAQYERAIADFSNAIMVNPGGIGAYNNRGNTYYELGLYERALENYDRAIMIDPTSSKSYINRGHSYRKLGQNEQAIENYDMAILVNPDNPEAYFGKASIYAMEGKAKDAIKWLQQSLTKDAKKCCELVKHDSDFDMVRENVEFQKLLKEFCEMC